MKTAISIPDPVFDAAERLSKRMRLSRSQLYARAVAGFVEQHQTLGVMEALNSVYREDTEDSGLDKIAQALQFCSLPQQRW